VNIAQFYVRVSRKSTTAKHSTNVQPLVCLAAHHFSVQFHCSPFHCFTVSLFHSSLFHPFTVTLHCSPFAAHHCTLAQLFTTVITRVFHCQSRGISFSQAVAGVRSNCVLFSSDRVCTQHHSTAYQGPLTEKKVLLIANSNELKNK